jgi:hypothetical protein
MLGGQPELTRSPGPSTHPSPTCTRSAMRHAAPLHHELHSDGHRHRMVRSRLDEALRRPTLACCRRPPGLYVPAAGHKDCLTAILAHGGMGYDWHRLRHHGQQRRDGRCQADAKCFGLLKTPTLLRLALLLCVWFQAGIVTLVVVPSASWALSVGAQPDGPWA